MRSWKHYIDGEWIASSNEISDVLNPFTEEKMANITEASSSDIDLAVKAARDAFRTWKDTTPMERSRLFMKLADLIEKNKERIAKIESENQGKTLATARADIDFAIDNVRFFAGACRSLSSVSSGDYIDKHDGIQHISLGTSVLRREPYGVVAAIIPWNYPFMIACWKLAAVAVGNTIILKPSSLTPLSAFELASLSAEAGFPKGVINVITGKGDRVGSMLAVHRNIDVIAFTGSTETGKEIMRLASRSLKKVHLELGGKAPFIVFDDADIEKASQYAIDASIVNSGQDCTAAARIYVQDSIYNKFIDKVKKKAQKVVTGDPLKSSTDIGPLVSNQQKERVASFLKGLEKGEKIIFQSKIPKKGFFHPVTIVRDFEQRGNLCQREIFGPIIAIASFETEDEVIKKANDVDYGLASSIWTNDVKRAFRVSRALNVGEVWINDHLPLVSEMPHGGIKQTGYGRDLSIYSLEEYTYLKHVYFGLS